MKKKEKHEQNFDELRKKEKKRKKETYRFKL
jgi:hypothetical protein